MVSHLHYFDGVTTVSIGVIDIPFAARTLSSALPNLRVLKLEDCEIVDEDGPVLDTVDEYEWSGWDLETPAVQGSLFLASTL